MRLIGTTAIFIGIACGTTALGQVGATGGLGAVGGLTGGGGQAGSAGGGVGGAGGAGSVSGVGTSVTSGSTAVQQRVGLGLGTRAGTSVGPNFNSARLGLEAGTRGAAGPRGFGASGSVDASLTARRGGTAPSSSSSGSQDPSPAQSPSVANRAALQADLALAHRIAYIDRLRDLAIANADTQMLLRADQLEYEAKWSHYHQVQQALRVDAVARGEAGSHTAYLDSRTNGEIAIADPSGTMPSGVANATAVAGGAVHPGSTTYQFNQPSDGATRYFPALQGEFGAEATSGPDRRPSYNLPRPAAYSVEATSDASAAMSEPQLMRTQKELQAEVNARQIAPASYAPPAVQNQPSRGVSAAGAATFETAPGVQQQSRADDPTPRGEVPRKRPELQNPQSPIMPTVVQAGLEVEASVKASTPTPGHSSP